MGRDLEKPKYGRETSVWVRAAGTGRRDSSARLDPEEEGLRVLDNG